MLKKFLYFLKRKRFLYFWKRNPALFSRRSKNKINSPRKRKVDFLIFWEIELLSPRLKKFLIFQGGTFLYLTFFTKMFFIRITRRNFYVISHKLNLFFFFNKILKTPEDNSFNFFYQLNQPILLLDKYIKSLLLVHYYYEFFIRIFY